VALAAASTSSSMASVVRINVGPCISHYAHQYSQFPLRLNDSFCKRKMELPHRS
jgi:hypothetical protein